MKTVWQIFFHKAQNLFFFSKFIFWKCFVSVRKDLGAKTLVYAKLESPKVGRILHNNYDLNLKKICITNWADTTLIVFKLCYTNDIMKVKKNFFNDIYF